MARLIDADVFRESIKGWKISKIPKGELLWCLDHKPTVDAVPVVRCKDCKHWYVPDGVCLKIYSDGAVSPYSWQDRDPDDFCSYGERKQNEY